MNLILGNARVVLADRILPAGSVVIEHGRIAAILDHPAGGDAMLDMAGDDLIPGLCEIHTDNLEKHLMPRNGVLWPILPAVITHDAQCVAAGITTVFDALAVGDLEGESVRLDTLHTAFEAILSGLAKDVFRAEHFIHLRCELAWPGLMPELARLVDHPAVRLVSVMDHTPGQRQYRDLAQYRKYYGKKNVGWTEDTFHAAVEARKDLQARHAATHRAQVIALAQARGIALASHDDTDRAHIDEAVASGIAISEFPTTHEAARAARAAGLATVMGAPNVVRGGSHSGNVAALALAGEGLLDILSSDYVPASLLHAAYLLAQAPGWSLPAAIATVSRNPARATGLADRGEIAQGQRADLVRVRTLDGLPLVRTVWRAGRPVF